MDFARMSALHTKTLADPASVTDAVVNAEVAAAKSQRSWFRAAGWCTHAVLAVGLILYAAHLINTRIVQKTAEISQRTLGEFIRGAASKASPVLIVVALMFVVYGVASHYITRAGDYHEHTRVDIAKFYLDGSGNQTAYTGAVATMSHDKTVNLANLVKYLRTATGYKQTDDDDEYRVFQLRDFVYRRAMELAGSVPAKLYTGAVSGAPGSCDLTEGEASQPDLMWEHCPATVAAQCDAQSWADLNCGANLQSLGNVVENAPFAAGSENFSGTSDASREDCFAACFTANDTDAAHWDEAGSKCSLRKRFDPLDLVYDKSASNTLFLEASATPDAVAKAVAHSLVKTLVDEAVSNLSPRDLSPYEASMMEWLANHDTQFVAHRQMYSHLIPLVITELKNLQPSDDQKTSVSFEVDATTFATFLGKTTVKDFNSHVSWPAFKGHVFTDTIAPRISERMERSKKRVNSTTMMMLFFFWVFVVFALWGLGTFALYKHDVLIKRHKEVVFTFVVVASLLATVHTMLRNQKARQYHNLFVAKTNTDSLTLALANLSDILCEKIGDVADVHKTVTEKDSTNAAVYKYPSSLSSVAETLTEGKKAALLEAAKQVIEQYDKCNSIRSGASNKAQFPYKETLVHVYLLVAGVWLIGKFYSIAGASNAFLIIDKARLYLAQEDRSALCRLLMETRSAGMRLSGLMSFAGAYSGLAVLVLYIMGVAQEGSSYRAGLSETDTVVGGCPYSA